MLHEIQLEYRIPHPYPYIAPQLNPAEPWSKIEGLHEVEASIQILQKWTHTNMKIASNRHNIQLNDSTITCNKAIQSVRGVECEPTPPN